MKIYLNSRRRYLNYNNWHKCYVKRRNKWPGIYIKPTKPPVLNSHFSTLHSNTSDRVLMFAEKHSSLSSYAQVDSLLWTIRGSYALGYPVAYPGEGPGGRSPLFLEKTEARRAEKKFWSPPPSPYLRFWTTGLPPLISRSGSGTATAFKLSK